MPDFKFKQSGKEGVEDLGLRWVDFGARQFDSQIGRSPVQDVLQERYPNEPAYVFAGNNPVYFTDAGGLFRIDPVTARDYPFLAKMIQYYLPLLKDNPIIRASFKRTGMTDEQFDEMVTYGTGSWITATRPDETKRHGLAIYSGIAGAWKQQDHRNIHARDNQGV